MGGNPILMSDMYGLSRQSICNGNDCVSPPVDATPNGPAPSPSKPPPAGGPSIWDRIFKSKDKKINKFECNEKNPTYATCYNCCVSKGLSTLDPSTFCYQSCNATPYPDNPYGDQGVSLSPPKMCKN